MEFSGKMSLKIILKVKEKQGFTLSLEDKFFEKPQRVVKWTTPQRPPQPSPAVLGLGNSIEIYAPDLFF